MIVEVEKQRHGIDLIKIDNDETNIVFKFRCASYHGSTMITTLY